MKQVFQTDWLASQPVFYHELTGKVSHNINDVIDLNNFEFHPEGLNNYLEFGYSVFEQTPIKHVKFLRHSSKLTIDEKQKLHIEHFDDIVEHWIGKISHEDDVLHLLYKSVQDWEKLVQGEIILPTSGGYDSRLLNCLIKNKTRIRAFTYGSSYNQSQSLQVVYANKLCKMLGIQWEQIILGDFHNFFEEWNQLFGISTHAHGMYHLEFYHKILPKIQGNNPLLSGITGGAWAGSVNIPDILSPYDVNQLGYSHNIKADSRMSQLISQTNLLENYYLSQQEKLNLDIFKVVEAMRFKIILLSYLIRVPKHLGFQVWSPFLVPEIALSMLTLPSYRRHNRLWQKEFFQKQGLNLEEMNLKGSPIKSLHHQAMRKVPVQPLDVHLLREIMQPSYIEWINKHITPNLTLWDIIWSIHRVPKVRKILYVLKLSDQRLKAYSAYRTLKPIENILKKRNQSIS